MTLHAILLCLVTTPPPLLLLLVTVVIIAGIVAATAVAAEVLVSVNVIKAVVAVVKGTEASEVHFDFLLSILFILFSSFIHIAINFLLYSG